MDIESDDDERSDDLRREIVWSAALVGSVLAYLVLIVSLGT